MDGVHLLNTNTTSIVEAAMSTARVAGITHDFYRYPARFSPLLARELIREFSDVGDLVVDPFLGGGTSAVESRILGREFIGSDINSLSTFLAKVKTTPLKSEDTAILMYWISKLPSPDYA